MSRSPASWLRLDVRGLGHPIRRRLPGTALGRMIRDTARQEWPLLVTNLASSLILGACEGLTLAVVYKASELLSGRHPVALPSRPLFQPAGAVQDWLSGLPVS